MCTKEYFAVITRKMHIISLVAPRQIRQSGDYYEYLKLEQETERAHNILNRLEIFFECVKNKSLKYFLMIRAYVNEQKSDLSLFKTKNPFKKCKPSD